MNGAPILGAAARLRNVWAHPWLALSIIEDERDTPAAVLTEGSVEVLTTVPDDVRSIIELHNRGSSLDWATTWLRVTRSGCSASPSAPGGTRPLAHERLGTADTRRLEGNGHTRQVGPPARP